jgi:hypothetical protein
MILLVWASERAEECARKIEAAFQQPVTKVSTLEEAGKSLQSERFTAVLLDQSIAEREPGETDHLIHHLGGAVPVFVNFGISGVERVLRELRAALNRQARESRLTQQQARMALWDSLKDDITGLLLCCGVILDDQSLSPALAVRVQTIEAIAKRLQEKLLVEEGRAMAASGTI